MILSSQAGWPVAPVTPVVTAVLVLGLASCSGQMPRVSGSREMSTPKPVPGTGRDMIALTVIYDNNQYEKRLRTDWGLSCLIQRGEVVVLFDTGGNGDILRSNISQLGLDGVEIDHIVLSHAHGDHTGGLSALLAEGIQPVVWVPHSFPAVFKDQIRYTTEIREISGPVTVANGIHSTGELGYSIIEQSLVLESDRGLVLITGCAHPGIVEIAARVNELHRGELYLVLGGFHLGGKSHAEVQQIAKRLKEIGVQKLAPCHCTGADETRWLAEEWGANLESCGVGRTIEVPL
jgi:7,8-dihydropterin-6-yl-methyl-4-(beta-D-ribofuranosyl)aminobenzene 5'-phosphate synthase